MKIWNDSKNKQIQDYFGESWKNTQIKPVWTGANHIFQKFRCMSCGAISHEQALFLRLVADSDDSVSLIVCDTYGNQIPQGRILSIYNGVLYPARCISKEAAEYFGFQLDRGGRIQVEI